MEKSKIRGSITNSQNIKDFPRNESLWNIMVPYIPLHSPVGALLLVFQCLKKVAEPQGFWLGSSKVFGDANFFSDRRELIEKSEEYLFSDENNGFFISNPMSSEEINKYIIQDLLVDYIETHPHIGELNKVPGEETRVFISAHVPETVKIWPMLTKEGWRFISKQPPTVKKEWNPSNLDDIVSFIQRVAFQTWLGAEVISKDPEESGPISAEAREAPIDLVVLSENLTKQFSALQKFFEDVEDSTYFTQEIGWIVSNLIKFDHTDTIRYATQSKNRYKFIRKEYPQAGMLVTAFALESDRGLIIRKWVEYYRERYLDQKDFLLNNISAKPYIPLPIPSVYPSKATKKTLRFVSDTKDNQNNRPPRRRFSFGGW